MSSKQTISLHSFVVQGQENVVISLSPLSFFLSIPPSPSYNLFAIGCAICSLINELISVN
ncbi:PqqD family protein, partial [Bacillus mycoides]|nr:PqqD family protein [Bacillus mycoides]